MPILRRSSRGRRGRTATLAPITAAVLGALGVAACGSGGGAASGARPADGGAGADATRGAQRDASLDAAANRGQADADAGASGDGGAPDSSVARGTGLPDGGARPDADADADAAGAPDDAPIDARDPNGDAARGDGGVPPADAAFLPARAIYSGVPWLDTAGHLVNAHGVGFLRQGATYYMVGEQRSGANDTYTGAPVNTEDTFTGVSLYATTDFANWTFVGTIVTPIPGTIVGPPYYGERPKLLYNAATGTYVLYIKMLRYVGTPPVYTGSYAVLTSDAVAGPYAYRGTLSITGASDFQLFEDTDGSVYLARDFGRLYKLAADGLSVASMVANGIQSGEGVSLYRAGATYFWQSSQGTYWASNDNSYSTATALAGPWTAHGFFCPAGTQTWQSQDTAVVPITGSVGTTYLYVGDRWVNGELPASTLVLQPMAVSGSTESIATYHPAWTLDVSAGTWADVTPSGTSVNDDATGTGPNQFRYSAGWTSAARSGAFHGDVHASSTTDATASLAFHGSQVLLYSAYDTSSGILGVTLSDDQGTAVTPEAHVSLRYDAPPAGNSLVYASPVVPTGDYTLTVRVTGRKDWYSSGVAINVDRVLVLP